jgi:uroporphyrinogen decarboxylase
MNHRERALAALRRQEPDRVPLDFGGTVDSTISALGYQPLRRALGLGTNVTRVQDVVQYTAVIEDDLRQVLDVDTTPVLDQPLDWRSGSLVDGSPALFPARFQPSEQQDGSQVVLDTAGRIALKMPAGGYYFDPVYCPLADATSVQDIESAMAQIETYDRPDHLDMTYEHLARKARALRESSERLLVGFFGGHIFQAAQSLRGWDTFLMDLLSNRVFAEALLDRLAEANIQRFERYAQTVGQYVDVVHFEDDLGMQDRPLLRPSLYRQLVKPYQKKLFDHAKSRCDALLLLHTDGAISPFIPDFIDMGIDAINPLQVSAAGMDPKRLKREFGRDIAFWGGACDSQTVLPFGTPEQVTDEVKLGLDGLMPGGGYVFSPIHNVQAEVPPQNVVALFQAARQYGAY